MSCGMPGVVQISPAPAGSGTFFGFLPGLSITARTSGRAKYLLRRIVPSTLRLTRSILVTEPLNSQVKIANRPSIEKSAWLMPAQAGVGTEPPSFIVCGSRKSSRL